MRRFNALNYSYLTIAFPVITVFCLFLFFRYYRQVSLPAPGTTEWITRIMNIPRFTIFYKRHKMERRDILPIVIITAVCAFLSFFRLGDLTAPQSFHRFTQDKLTVYIKLQNPTELGGVVYYSGLWTGSYTLEISGDGTNWQRQHPAENEESEMDQPHSDLFKWLFANLNEDNAPTKYIRITASKSPIELGELALYTKTGDLLPRTDISCDAPELFDEQALVPAELGALVLHRITAHAENATGQPGYHKARDHNPSYMNSMYFDEIYHGRTAYEYLQGVKVYETTHPPLGKLILTIGIRIFGMVPFGWRFMGTLYIFLKNMFGKTIVAACGTILFGMDFMHFVQTRIATIDTYGVIFIMLSYFFMYRFMTADPEKRFLKTLPSLALSGLFFGIGCASKWTVIYAGAGLLVLYLLRQIMAARFYRDSDIPGYALLLLKNLLCAFVFFIAIPAVIYCASYIPNGIIAGMSLKDGMLWDPQFYKLIWDNQTFMFSYHSKLVATHSYSSVWWQWITDARPILYYRSYTPEGLKAAFASFGNPIVWWGGFMAMIAMGVRFFKYRDGKALFILIGYLSQFMPWLFITRVVFIYHYFPSVLFLVLALSHVLDTLQERARGRYQLAAYGLTGASVLLFAVFYPVLTGTPIPELYTKFLRWIPEGAWPF
jgi:hypothetical protein